MTIGGPIRWGWCIIGGLILATLTGCGSVNRRFVIESNVPGAQVYINNRQIGAAPAHANFDYYGYYKITVIHPDYETHTQRVHVVAPWYAYPPLDFLTEVVWPFEIHDTRRYYFNLGLSRQTNTAELLTSADALRERGWKLPPPPPQPSYAKKNPPPALEPPVPAPQAPDQAPGTAVPGPAPPGNPLPAPSVVPSVTPTGYTPPRSETYLK